MKECFKEALTSYIKKYLKDKNILKNEFMRLSGFFSALKINTDKNFIEVFNDHLTEAIVTSLLVYLSEVEKSENGQYIFKSDSGENITTNGLEILSGEDVIIPRIEKAVQVAKETFAYSIHAFQDKTNNLKEKKND